MVFCEMLEALEEKGLDVTPTQVRWAISQGRVERPRVDRSYRFDFSQANVDELVAYFKSKQATSA